MEDFCLIPNGNCHGIFFQRDGSVLLLYVLCPLLIIYKTVCKFFIIIRLKPYPVCAEIQRIKNGFDQIPVAHFPFCHAINVI